MTSAIVEHGHALGRRGKACADDGGAQPDGDSAARTEPIDQPADQRRGQPEELRDGDRHADVGQLGRADPGRSSR